MLDCGWWPLWDKTAESHSPQPGAHGPNMGSVGVGPGRRPPLPGVQQPGAIVLGCVREWGEGGWGSVSSPDTQRSPWTPR